MEKSDIISFGEIKRNAMTFSSSGVSAVLSNINDISIQLTSSISEFDIDISAINDEILVANKQISDLSARRQTMVVSEFHSYDDFMDIIFDGSYIYYDGSMPLNSNYRSYTFLAKNDFTLWAISSELQYDTIIALYGNGEISKENYKKINGGSGVRYRNRPPEVGTVALPTEDNPLSITKGQLLVVSVASKNLNTFTLYASGAEITQFEDGYQLSNDALKSVQHEINTRCKLYVDHSKTST